MHPALLAMAIALMPATAALAEVTPGTVAIVADGGATATDPATTRLEITDPVMPTFVDAVRQAMLRTGFVPLPDPDHSRYIARVAVAQASRGVVTSADSGTGSAAAPIYQGGGVSLSLPSGKGRLRGLIVTRLTVVVSLRRDGQVAWTGQATTARIGGTPGGTPAVVATALADALFQRFPQPLAEPISVP